MAIQNLLGAIEASVHQLETIKKSLSFSLDGYVFLSNLNNSLYINI